MSEHGHSHENAKAHPSSGQYVLIGAILTVITLVEVGVFYVEQLQSVLAPVLLVLSAAKFALVVMFYMHLKGDHKLFTWIFVGPLMIAAAVIIAMLFLFQVFP